jgi:tRNA(adenine34) deaminase
LIFAPAKGIVISMVDELYMEMCLHEAEKAFDEGEVPVGALVVSPEGSVIAKAHNLTITRNSPTAHAEILALNEASRVMGNYRLVGCSLYVTMEPCVMCAGALIEARVKSVVFGCHDKKRGALGSVTDINSLPLNHKLEVKGGVHEEKSRMLLKKFFQIRRGTEVVITGPTRNRLYA